MEKYYKISAVEADLLGKFYYKNSIGVICEFDSKVGEQADGSFLISEETYNEIKDTEEFRKVNFLGKQSYVKEILSFKTIVEEDNNFNKQ